MEFFSVWAALGLSVLSHIVTVMVLLRRRRNDPLLYSLLSAQVRREGLPFPMLFASMEGVVLSCNQHFERMLLEPMGMRADLIANQPYDVAFGEHTGFAMHNLHKDAVRLRDLTESYLTLYVNNQSGGQMRCFAWPYYHSGALLGVEMLLVTANPPASQRHHTIFNN